MTWTSQWRSHISGYLQGVTSYELMAAVLRGIREGIRHIQAGDRMIASFKAGKSSEGVVLLSHRIEPFVKKTPSALMNSHTAYWEVLQIVQTFLEFNYDVDVISFRNSTFQPFRDYAFFIDTRYNFERIVPFLREDCVKILHGETTHVLYHCHAELQRLHDLYRRKGVTLHSRRWEWPNKATELADFITIYGNEFTRKTYEHTHKPIYCLPISTTLLQPWPAWKNFDACRKHFLWFGSGGMVHKGLDLVLEAFAGMPEYHLTVCGPVRDEKDFEQAFYQELYQTKNIHTVGWIDTDSVEFRQILEHCNALVYPTCSEGQSGGVVECLHAGLIPIVSYQSGVDVHDFGVNLRTCTIEEIREAVRMVASLPARDLEAQARAAWEFARANHTRERFAQEYRRVVKQILATSSAQRFREGA